MNWKGEEVKARMLRAARYGINKTMGECVADAKITHPFTNRSTNAEGSITVVAAAVTAGGKTFGMWGSAACIYFKYLEFGTAAMKRGKKVASDTWKGLTWAPTLRPVAARIYPKLMENIIEGWRSA